MAILLFIAQARAQEAPKKQQHHSPPQPHAAGTMLQKQRLLLVDPD
ncbi:hypothetical protein SOVF_055660 [Spinacia oleracea]|nr:hypothetical protein SOVF_055660 [Spinacia oleracea]